MKQSIIFAALFALALSAAGQPLLAEKVPAWQIALQSQLLTEKQCNLNYLTNVKIKDLGAITSIAARAHCINGQAYDVQSMHGTTKFEIRECGMSVC